MFSFSVSSLIVSAGSRPALQFLAIVLGTFILEDAATVIAATEAEAGKVEWKLAIVALFAGIVLGDLGLYGSGRLASFWPWLKNRLRPAHHARGQDWFRLHLFRVVFISRFVPGARLPTYTACGFFRAGFLRFALAAISATLVWTSLLFALSERIGKILLDHFGAWRWLGIACFVALVLLGGRILARFVGEAS